MSESHVATIEIQDYSSWDRQKQQDIPLSFELEITARCNNDCLHCYINVPAGDSAAKARRIVIGRDPAHRR